MLAALIEIPFTGFGAVVLWLGLLQGLGVELVFLATRTGALICSCSCWPVRMGALVAVIGYSYVTEGWLGLEPGLQILRIILKLLGGAILAGLLAK